jgi:hypothetical protein
MSVVLLPRGAVEVLPWEDARWMSQKQQELVDAMDPILDVAQPRQ